MKKWLSVFGYTILAVIVYYLIEILFQMTFGAFIRTATTKAQVSQYTLIANVVLKAVMLLAFGCWYKFRKCKWKQKPNYAKAFSVKNCLCLLGIGLFGQYAMSFVLNLIHIAFPAIFENYQKVTQAVSLDNDFPLVILFLVVILGPIAEEVLFRGVLYGQLREVCSVTQAALIAGVLFGAYHKNLVQGIYATIFGIILAYLYEKTNTIWGAIITHMMFNLSSYLITVIRNALYHYNREIPAVYLFAIQIICLILICVMLNAIRKGALQNSKDKRENELFEEGN